MASSIVNAVGTFTDDDIIKIAPEVVNPVLDGWEFFVESMGVQIHRKYREVSGKYRGGKKKNQMSLPVAYGIRPAANLFDLLFDVFHLRARKWHRMWRGRGGGG